MPINDYVYPPRASASDRVAPPIVVGGGGAPSWVELTPNTTGFPGTLSGDTTNIAAIDYSSGRWAISYTGTGTGTGLQAANDSLPSYDIPLLSIFPNFTWTGSDLWLRLDPVTPWVQTGEDGGPFLACRNVPLTDGAGVLIQDYTTNVRAGCMQATAAPNYATNALLSSHVSVVGVFRQHHLAGANTNANILTHAVETGGDITGPYETETGNAFPLDPADAVVSFGAFQSLGGPQQSGSSHLFRVYVAAVPRPPTPS